MSIFRRYFCIIDENMTSSVNDNNPNHLNIDKYCSLIEDVYSMPIRLPHTPTMGRAAGWGELAQTRHFTQISLTTYSGCMS